MDYENTSEIIQFSTLPAPDNKYILERLIAEGAFGAVYEAEERWKTSSKVAVKVVTRIAENVRQIEQEYQILSQLSGHENFPEFFGLFLNKEEASHEIWFAMELCSRGSVGDLTRNMVAQLRHLPEDLISYIFFSVTKGLSYLNLQKSIHRDVKCDNILITDTGGIKICDFGQVGSLEGTLSRRGTCIGSVCWVAPEVVTCSDEGSADYDRRCDVWSLAISVIECCEGYPPLSSLPPIRALFHIAHNPPPTLARPQDWSESLKDFVAECLVKNPEHRPHMEELLEHPFLSTSQAQEAQLNLSVKLVDLVLQTSKGKTTTPGGSQIHKQALIGRNHIKRDRLLGEEKMVVEDLAALDDYSEQICVEALKERWESGQLYTWMADVLLAVNTNDIKHTYDNKTHMLYRQNARSDNAPHIFAVADKAHQDALHHKQPQTIVLTGESGAGKSFSFQKLVDHLCFIGGRSSDKVIQRIQSIVPVLDAFGNATTELNSNATRHVRHFEILLTPTGKISGLQIAISLLEKLRLTHIPGGESNFHVLYYLYDGLSQTGRLKQYGLSVGRRYSLLAVHSTDNEVQNGHKLTELENCLDIIGFTEKEISAAYQILAGILHLGNVEFRQNKHQGASVVDQEPVRDASQQLGVDDRKLAWALCNCCTVAGSTVNPKVLTLSEAEAARDALIQALYSRLVDTIIELINAKMAPRKKSVPKLAVSVLDLPGFEATEHNRLEQLMVNVLNEQIQYFYNQVTFTWEMNDYENEGVSGTKLYSFPDNRHLLELFLSKKTGIMDLIESETRTGLNDCIDDKMSKKAEGRLVSRMAPNIFAIAHFVGRVKYDFSTIINRNKDGMTSELILTMRRSTTPLVAAMFTAQLTRTGHLPPNAIQSRLFKKDTPRVTPTPEEQPSSKMSQTRHLMSQIGIFRHSLIALLYKLTHATPHFVRCIRGSMEDTDTFDVGMVKHQIKYHAVCDTITIRQQGFSHRLHFSDFLQRYQTLAFNFDETVDMTSSNARLLLVRLKMEGWAVGATRVFLKYYMEEYLNRIYERHLRSIVKVQAMIRTYIQIRRLKRQAGLAVTPKDSRKEIKSPKRFHERAAKNIEGRVRFNEDTIEGEAARVIQLYYRRWKLKSMFQTLLIYRSEKMLQLVYFCQQVHLFGQECQSKVYSTCGLVPLARIAPRPSGSHKTLLASHSVKLPRLPLDHTLATYFDTSYLCHPSRVHRQQDDDWEGPFKSRQAAQRASNMGAADYSLSSDVPLPPISNHFEHLQAQGASASKFDIGGLVNGGESRSERSVVYKSSKPESREQANADIDRDCGSLRKPSAPRNSYNRFAVVNPTAKAPTNIYGHYNFSYLKPTNGKQPPTSVPAKPSSRPEVRLPKGPPVNGPHAALNELKMKANRHSQNNGNQELSIAHSKLRKTNYSRDSMRRAHEVVPNNNNNNYGRTTTEIKITKPSTIMAPGPAKKAKAPTPPPTRRAKGPNRAPSPNSDIDEEIRRLSSDLMDIANENDLSDEFNRAFTANSDEAQL